MAKPWAVKFYHSDKWHACRNAFVMERVSADGGLCQACGKRPGVIVHHRIELTPTNISDPEITLNHDNLILLCHQCHDDIHLHGGLDLFDSDGNYNGTITAAKDSESDVLKVWDRHTKTCDKKK